MNYQANEEDVRLLEEAYRGRRAFHGELHDHSNSGGTSDGHCTLDEWKVMLAEKKMDFAAILDHRQVRHMYLPEWDGTLFLCGSEPGTSISDSRAPGPSLHYNMLVPGPAELEAILAEFPEFEFTGGPEGHFRYPSFTTERFGELMDAVKAKGGLFVLPHPKQIMRSDDPADFWFRDYTGIEAIYMALDSDATAADSPLWFDLLRMGRRVWACAGGDLHGQATDGALTTVYAEEKRNTALLSVLRTGDFTAGSAGVRMRMGDSLAGGHTDFAGKRLILSAGDFHGSVVKEGHAYRLDLLAGDEKVFSAPVDCGKPSYFALDADPSVPFYRAEVWDETENLRLALGNPVWNDGIR